MVTLVHGTVGSNDLEKAKAFYDELLGSAGITALFEHPSGGRVYGKEGSPFFVVLGPYDKKPATVGNGSMHGFRFDTRGQVDAFHPKLSRSAARTRVLPASARRNSTCPISGTSTATSSALSASVDHAPNLKPAIRADGEPLLTIR